MYDSSCMLGTLISFLGTYGNTPPISTICRERMGSSVHQYGEELDLTSMVKPGDP